MLTIQQPLLNLALRLSIEHPPSHEKDPLRTIFRHLSLFGSVSSSFRKITSNVISNCLDSLNPCFDVIKHKSHYHVLKSFTPSFSFSLTTLLHHVGSSRIVDLSSFEILSLRLRSSSQPTTPELLSNFFNVNSFNNVEKLVINSVCNEEICNIISINLPSLKSLSFRNSFLEDYFIIPSFLSRLNEFSYESECFTPNSSFSLNVSNLINLNKIIISHRQDIRIVGLSQLSHLTHGEFTTVNFQDTFHKDVKLKILILKMIESESIEKLLVNKENFETCKIELFFSEVPSSIDWIYDLNITTITTSSDRNSKDGLFCLSKTPSLEKLFIMNNSDFKICLCKPQRLTSFFVSNVFLPEFVNFNISSKFCPTLLTLNSFDLLMLVFFLEQFNHITSLDLTKQKVEKSVIKPPSISLNYLRNLSLNSVNSVCFHLPVLPKLLSLSVRNVRKFDLNFLNTKCPNVCFLELINCSINSKLNSPNHSVVDLNFVSVEEFFPSSDVLSPFEGVKHLSLHISGVHSVKSIAFPPNLTSLYLAAPFKLVASSCSRASFITVMTLVIEVTEHLTVEKQSKMIKMFDKNKPSNLAQLNVSFSVSSD
ncbi:hypothetical protein RCL1_001245 [Eukaryota sp. TZLM3-RCL]